MLGLSVDALFLETGRPVGEELLMPTRIYAAAVRRLLGGVEVRAMAHITGGGMTGNLPRVLPEGCRAIVHRDAWPVPAVFRVLQAAGRVSEAEMFTTFNMGVGYVAVVPEAAAAAATALLRDAGETVFALGEIVAGPRGVELA